MLGDGADPERKRPDDSAHKGEVRIQAFLYHTPYFCFDEGNHNQPVYICIDYNNRN